MREASAEASEFRPKLDYRHPQQTMNTLPTDHPFNEDLPLAINNTVHQIDSKRQKKIKLRDRNHFLPPQFILQGLHNPYLLCVKSLFQDLNQSVTMGVL